MKIQEIWNGLKLIEYDKHEDERGFFMKTFDAGEFRAAGIHGKLSEIATSYNRKGVLRGLHYQEGPWFMQGKLVRVVRGSIFDVVVNNRLEVYHTTLQDCALWVPQGFAHGFLALEEDTEIQYLLTAPRKPELERGIRWDDPVLSIPWPSMSPIVNERDRNWPLLSRNN